MTIKKGDTIIVRIGKNRGKKGTVARMLPSRGLILVSGVNLYKKHVRPKKQGEKGQLVELMRPLQLSNVALFCSNCGRASRVGYRVDGAKKVRFCRRCSVAL
ncbi:MAG: 50S ribosomal protein L24 [bacterium]|nr:50S ribosomal protein L24 [bacterium]